MCNKVILGSLIILNNVFIVLSVTVSEEHENVWTQQSEPSFKYTVEQLLVGDFPKRTSDDIYLDPCKAGKSCQRHNSFYSGVCLE